MQFEGSPQVSNETVEQYFGEYGWTFETLQDGVWRTGFRGENGFFTIFIRLTDAWLYMTISPFVPAPTDEICKVQAFEAMLHFNRDMNLAKFVLDEDEDITLTVELPIAALLYPVFAEGLTALAYYADDVHDEMLEISTDRTAISRFKGLGGIVGKTIRA
jgi:hypothetical protein